MLPMIYFYTDLTQYIVIIGIILLSHKLIYEYFIVLQKP